MVFHVCFSSQSQMTSTLWSRRWNPHHQTMLVSVWFTCTHHLFSIRQIQNLKSYLYIYMYIHQLLLQLFCVPRRISTCTQHRIHPNPVCAPEACEPKSKSISTSRSKSGRFERFGLKAFRCQDGMSEIYHWLHSSFETSVSVGFFCESWCYFFFLCFVALAAFCKFFFVLLNCVCSSFRNCVFLFDSSLVAWRSKKK